VTRRTARSTFLVRAATVTALTGHWIANALFDRDQYEEATEQLLSRLDDPMLVQAAVGVLLIAALTIWDRHRGATSCWRPGGLLGVLALAAFQLAVFVALEGSERLAIEAVAGEQTTIAPFEVGFVAELLVAVGAALVFSVVGEAARRCLDARGPRGLVARSEHAVSLRTGHVPTAAALVGAGGVRAPPR
jgi:hypothetical protein